MSRRVLRFGYRTLVVLSAVIVGAYVVHQFAIRPPAQADAPPSPPAFSATPTPGSGSSGDVEPSPTPTATPLVRKEQFYTFLLAASDQTSGNSDTIMVVSYDVPNHKVNMVSIPRDTLVDRVYKNKRYYKINTAYAYGGVEELRDAVSELLGIPIDYYVTVNIRGFKALVDQVGGVDMYVPVNMDYDDPTQDLHIHFTKGMHHMDGQAAMEFCRFRHGNVGSGVDITDVGRSKNQQALMIAVAKKMLSWNSLTKVTNFVDIFNTYVKTDLQVTDMVWFAEQAYLSLDPGEDVQNTTFTGDGTVTYKGITYCYQYDLEKALETINTMLNPYTTALTAANTRLLQVK